MTTTTTTIMIANNSDRRGGERAAQVPMGTKMNDCERDGAQRSSAFDWQRAGLEASHSYRVIILIITVIDRLGSHSDRSRGKERVARSNHTTNEHQAASDN